MPDRWSDECEELLAEWSEKASCYRWLHGRCEKKYKKQYYAFSIPVIILSTLTGAANVGMDSFVPAEQKPMASAIVGGVNIFAGILSTLQNFLKVAELMEAHRMSGVAWSKLGRNIAIELALDHSKRSVQNDFLKISRAEYDRLIESSPMIDDDIIQEFQKKFKNYDVKLAVPAICNGFDKCDIYRVDDAIERHHENFFDGIDDLVTDEEKNLVNNLRDKIANKDIYKKMKTEVERRVTKELDQRVSVELDKLNPKKKVNLEDVMKENEKLKGEITNKIKEVEIIKKNIKTTNDNIIDIPENISSEINETNIDNKKEHTNEENTDEINEFLDGIQNDNEIKEIEEDKV